MTMNVIYFVKTDPTTNLSTLWRRTMMPANYNTPAARCSTPFQQPSCAPGVTSSLCATNDVKLVEGVPASGFFVQYFTAANSDIPDTVSSDTGATVADRNAALRTTPTIAVSIVASQAVAGKTIERSATLRATRLDINASTIADTLVQSSLSGAPTNLSIATDSGSQVTASWDAPSGFPTSYTLHNSRKSDFSSPTTLSNISATTKAVTGLTGATGYFFRVSATNSFGTTSYSSGVLGSTTGNNTWTACTKFTGVGDWNKDGKNDMMCYLANGDVELHLGNGDGQFGGRILIANIGTTVKSFIGPGTLPSGTAPILWWSDTTGAGYALRSDGGYGVSGSTITSAPAGSFSSCIDVFAAPYIYTNNTTVVVICHSGALYNWSLNSAGTATFVSSAGSGWDGYAADTVFGGGDFSIDGKGDILVTNSAGTLIFYQGNGAGFVTSSSTQGSGWINNRVTSGWDYTGDNKNDILRFYTPTNTFYLYTGCGCGTTSTSFVIN